MKILYLVSSHGITLDNSGGAGTHIRGTIQGFKENGHDVMVCIHGDNFKNNVNNSSLENIKYKNLKYYRKKFIPNKIRAVLRDMRRAVLDTKYVDDIFDEVLKFSPDFIYERSCYLSFAGNRLAKKLKIPHFLETSGVLSEIMTETNGGIGIRIGNMIEKYKLKHANVVVTEADAAKSFIRSKFNLINKTIISKPLGIDRNFLNNSNQLKQKKIKNKFQLDNKIVVGFVGSFAVYQRVELLKDVLNHFKTSNKIKFLFIGDGGNSNDLQNYVEINQIHNAFFTGKVSRSELVNYMALFDIGIVPDSAKHMHPIKIIEYGLLDICPLAPNYEAFHDLIIHKENGLLFKANDVKDIISKLTFAIKHQDKIKKIGVEWKKYVTTNFYWKQVVLNVLILANKLE